MFNIDSSKRNKAFIFLKYEMSTILTQNGKTHYAFQI